MNYNQQGSVASQGAMDLGLRSFMLGTYKYMIAAMGVSGIVAYVIGTYFLKDANGYPNDFARLLFSPMGAIGLTIGIMVAFGSVGSKLQNMSINGVKMFLFGFAAVMGVWLSGIAGFAGDQMVAVRIFFMAAAMFGAISLFGYTTKKDLGGIAKFAFMVFAGFIILSIASMFIPSIMAGTMGIVLNVVGLLAIAGITAWETQHLKQIYYGTVGSPEMAEKYSVFGAASLLLSFINIFSILMNLFGGE